MDVRSEMPLVPSGRRSSGGQASESQPERPSSSRSTPPRQRVQPPSSLLLGPRWPVVCGLRAHRRCSLAVPAAATTPLNSQHDSRPAWPPASIARITSRKCHPPTVPGQSSRRSSTARAARAGCSPTGSRCRGTNPARRLEPTWYGQLPGRVREEARRFRPRLRLQAEQGCNSGVFLRVGDLNDPVNTGIEVALDDTTGSELTRFRCASMTWLPPRERPEAGRPVEPHDHHRRGPGDRGLAQRQGRLEDQPR